MKSASKDLPTLPRARPVLTAGEVLAFIAALGLVLGTWSSLLLADISQFSGAKVVALTLVTLGLCVAVIWTFARPAIHVDWRELAGLGALALLAAAMFIPGFRYAAGDKDPGVYVSQAYGIAREGSTSLTDPIREIADDLPDEFRDSTGVSGFYVDQDDPDRWISRFYNLWSTSLATMKSLAGDRALYNLNPVLGVLSVLTLTLAVRRAINWQTGAIAGGLLAVNMIQVWQAKYQTAEILTQLLVVGALFGIVLALRRRWVPAAALAGVLTGLTFLARPDAVALILLGLGGAGTMFALRRYTRESLWYACGIVVTLPHAFNQAYGVQRFYTLETLPSAAVVGPLIGLLAIGSIAGRWLVVPLASRLWAEHGPSWDRERVVTVVGIGVVTTFGLVLLLGALRPWIQGDLEKLWSTGEVIRTWNERNVLRLSWFLTIPGMVLAWLGLAVIALRERTAAAWVLVLPGIISLPIYLYDADISPRLMWWVRRFVPVVFPTLIILIALALGFALLHRGRWRIPVRVTGAVLTAGLASVYLSQSLPLRSHHEFSGTVEATAELAELAEGEQAAFLWVDGAFLGSDMLLKTPLYFIQSQISTTLPAEPQQSHVDAIAELLPGQQVFIVSADDALPPGLDSERYELVDQRHVTTPIWEEPSHRRPTKSRDLQVITNVWALQ